MRQLLTPLLLALATFSACSRDLGVPPPPEAGALKGALQDGAATAIGGVSIELLPEETRDGGGAGGVSAADGTFLITGVEPGRYAVRFSLDGFIDLQRFVTIPSKVTKDLGTLTMQRLATPGQNDGFLSGKVQIATGASPLGSEVAFVEPATQQKVAFLTVGASGDFVQRLPPGDWRVVASHPLYVASPPQDVTLAARESKTLPPLQLEIDPGTVTGRVSRELDLVSATADAPSATITSDTNVTTTTDAQGRFQLGMLAGGARRLRITLPGYRDSVEEHVVNVVPGMTTSLPDVVLALERGSIQGEVEMGDNTPLQDVTASLNLSSPDAGLSPYAVQVSPAGSRGSYVIRGVPVGDYTVRAGRNNYIAANSGQVRVVAGSTAQADLLRLFRIQGDFEIDDGDPTNAPGFSRTQNLTLRLSNTNNPTEYRVAETSAALMTTPFSPFGAADAGSVTPTNIPYALPSGDGVHTIFIQYRDGQGNLSAALSGSIVLDTAPPLPDAVSPLVLEGGAAFTRQNVRLSVEVRGSDPRATGVDNVSGVGFVRLAPTNALDAQGRLQGPLKVYGVGLQFDRTVTTDGVQTVYAQFVDNAGNHSTALAQAQVVVDTLAPTGTMTITRGARASANGFTNDPNVELVFSVAAEPNGGSVLVRRANDTVADLATAPLLPAQASMSWPLTPTDGLHTVHYRLVDAAGNEATNALQTITLDRTAPVGSLSLASPALTRALAQTLVVGATDANGLSTTNALALSEELSFSSAGTVSFATLPGSNPVFTLPSGDGLRTIYARYRDVAGNDSTAVAQVRVDQTPPAGSISLLGTLGDGTRSASLTSTASVDVLVQRGDAVSYFPGDGTLSTCPTSGYTALPASNVVPVSVAAGGGAREVRFCLADLAGNAQLTSATITLDSTAPVGCTLTLDGRRADGSPSGASKTANPAITVTASGCSDATEIYLTDGTPACTSSTINAYQSFRSPLPFLISGANGLSTVRGCVRDAARNAAAVVSAAITLDTQGPTSASISINGNAPYINASQVSGGRTTLTVSATVSDATEWALSTTGTPTAFAALGGGNASLPNTPVTPDGLYTVYAAFRDDVGNQTQATIADSITVDTTPPSIAGLVLDVRSTGDAGFTNSEAVTVAVTGSTDAVDAFLAERTAAGACATTDLSSAPRQAVVSAWTFVLSPLEGPRKVCVRYRDAAGNDSVGGVLGNGVLQDDVFLDKTPPSTPQIVTPDSFSQLADFDPMVVNISAPSSDNVGFSYQRLGGYEDDGGLIIQWSPTAPSGPQTRFTFRVRNDGSERGVRNELRLRAIDPAGNASGDSVVFITADTNAPEPVEVAPEWVDNANGRASVYFKKPTAVSDGVAGLHVYYSSNPLFKDTDTATFAAEGNSPITIPLLNNATLSGLPNGTPTFVRIRPFDEAGNEAGDGGTVWVGVDGGNLAPIRLQPDEVSANEINSLALPAVQDNVHRLTMHDSVLYVLTSSTFCTTNLAYALHAVNLRGLDASIQNGKIKSPGGPIIASTLTLTGNTLPCDAAGASNADMLVEGNWGFVSTPSRIFIVDLSEPLFPSLYTSFDIVAGIDPSVGSNFKAEGLRAYGERLAIGGRRVGNGTFAAMWNLSKLYDQSSGTLPLASDKLASSLTATQAPTAVAFTRDRMIAFGTAGLTYRFNLAPALATAATAPTYDGLTAFAANQLSRPPVSGNLLYPASEFYGLNALTLATAWLGSDPNWPASSTWFTSAHLGSAQHDVVGHQAFLPEATARGLRIVDIADRLQVRSVGLNTVSSGLAPTHLVSYGNYVITANGQQLKFYEVATPRALTNVAAVGGSGYFPEVVGGFVFTGGRVFDLQSGAQPAVPDSTVATCWNGASYGEDFEIEGRGDGFAARSLDTATDRSGTSFASSTDVILAGSRVTDVQVWGNYVVVAEVRASGYWLEAFDLRRVRNRAGTSISTADSVGSLQIAAIASPPAATMLTLTIVGGRAAIGVDSNDGSIAAAALGNNLYFTELKGMLDDNALTVGGPVHGPVSIHQVRQVAMQGNYAYVATSQGLRVLDITNVMDASAATLLPANPVVATLLDGNWLDGVFVAGSMLLTTPSYTASAQPLPQGVYSIDISSPPAPEVEGFYPRLGDKATCFPPGDVSARRLRMKITAAGSRAYFNTAAGALQILDLE